MSVVVKGMKMPENCGKCPFLIEEDIDFDICRQCGAGKSGYIYEKDIDGFPSDCPLIALPDKHGRLGDLDALIIDLMNRVLEGIQTDDWAEIQQTVMEQPTIVEAEGENADHE